MKRVLTLGIVLLCFLGHSAVAQNWTDDFGDTDFTGGLKSWSGESTLWQVTAGQLRSNGIAGTDTTYLSTPSNLALDTQWEFWMRLSFNPSANNYADVYLISDSADVTHPQSRGYYLRIGSSDDDIKLWYRNGLVAPTMLIDGSLTSLATTNNILKVKVTRTAAGLWTLFADATGTGSSYAIEGNFTDNTLTQSAHFGVVARHTSSNFNRFYFDDFLVVSPIPVDNTPPTVNSVTVTALNQLSIVFSESLDLITSQNTANYLVAGNTVVSAVRNPANTVVVTFQNNFPPSIQQTITISNVRDVAANSMTPAQFNFQRGDDPAFGDVVINEIIGDVSPVVGLPQVEWFELYNRSTKTFNIQNWKIASQLGTGSPTELLLPAFTLSPDTYVVVCTIAGKDSFTGWQIQVIDPSAFNTNFLTSTGRLISLYDSSGIVLDTVNYLSSWYKNTTKANGGWSIEKINPFDTCAAAFDNWAASTDPSGGTPGKKNSIWSTTSNPIAPVVSSLTIIDSLNVQVCFSVKMDPAAINSTLNYTVSGSLGIQLVSILNADFTCVQVTFLNPIQLDTLYTLNINGVQNCYNSGSVNLQTNFIENSPPKRNEIIINEIFADQTPQIGLPNAEFVELHNRSNRALNIAGWKLNEGSSSLTALPSIVLLPNDYLILCHLNNYWDFAPFGQTVGLNSFSLTNSGELLTLMDSTGVIIDAVTYSDTWHNDAVKDDGGWSLERIDRNDTCSTFRNWKASEAGIGGTPGTLNSVDGIGIDTLGPVLLSVSAISTDTIIACFDEPVSLNFIGNLAHYAIQNNDLIISSVMPISPAFECVQIVFATPMTAGQVYQLNVSSLEDCKGNSIVSGSNRQFVLNPPIQRADLVINEIFADPTPAVSLPESQFAEIYNRSVHAFDVTGLKFNGRTMSYGVIKPGEYLIITRTDNSGDYTSYGNVNAVPSLASFTQSAYTMELTTANDEVIDEVSYTRDWYKDGVKQNGGWTLERINPDDTCATFSNWIASVDSSGGTPGAANSVMNSNQDANPPTILDVSVSGLDTVYLYFSETLNGVQASDSALYSVKELSSGNVLPVLAAHAQSPDYGVVRLTLGAFMQLANSYEVTLTGIEDCKGNSANLIDTFVVGDVAVPNEIVLNEIYTDVTPLVGLPAVKFLEIYNRTNKPFDLTGWSIRKFNSSGEFSSTYSFDNPRVLLPGQYLVICPTSAVSQYQAYSASVLGAGSLSFNISSDNIALVDAEGVVIDRVSYVDDWYRDNVKDEGGWSLERIDPDYICADALNWIASSDSSGGTPGRINSKKASFSDTIPPSLLNAFVLAKDTLVLQFSEPLEYLSTLDPSNFEISSGIGNPINVIFPGQSTYQLSTVWLVLTTPLDSNKIYTITLKNLKDCPGNTIPSNLLVEVAIPVIPEVKELLINEVLFYPYTGRNRFVEIYNHSDNIFDLSKVYLAEVVLGIDSIQSVKPLSETPRLMFPRTYLCLTPNVQDQLDVYQPKENAKFLQIPSIPAYSSTKDEVMLIYADALVTPVTSTTPLIKLDRFYYEDTYHFPDLISKRGVSLERLNFEGDSQNKDLWHSAASTVLYATPGYENSQQLRPQSNGEVSVFPETFSPDGDGFEDILSINYKFTKIGNNARIAIYDAVGNRVKILRPNFLLETEEGFVTWDGTNDSGNKAPVGVYLVVFEVMQAGSGDREVYKVPCVLAAKLN
jgi:hypothetical protein